MPYSVRKISDGKWGKYKKTAGGRFVLVSTHKTRAKAQASIKAYYANKK